MLEKLKNKLDNPDLQAEQKEFYNSAILAYEVIIIKTYVHNFLTLSYQGVQLYLNRYSSLACKIACKTTDPE